MTDWTLIVSIATLIVACWTLYYNFSSNKKRKKAELAKKVALLKSLEEPFATYGLDHTVADHMRMQKSMLKIEIEQLKKEIK